MVRTVPAAPEVGEMPVIVGVASTRKVKPLLAAPFTVTTTGPEVAPLGTDTEICVSDQLVGVASTPLKVIVLPPCEVPKYEPLTTTAEPTKPEDCTMEAISGGCEGVPCPVVKSKVKTPVSSP